MSPDANTAFARALVDEWVRAGVTDACVAPGSRNAPLALALAADPRIRVHTHLDERSAGFFALGAARGHRAGRRRLLHLRHGGGASPPRRARGRHGGVPLLVCTADRPPELRDTGAGPDHRPGRPLRAAPCAGPATSTRPRTAPGIGRVVAVRSAPAPSPWRSGRPPAPCTSTSRSASRSPRPARPLVDAPGRADGRPWTSVRRRRPASSTTETLDELAARRCATPGGACRGRLGRRRRPGRWSRRSRPVPAGQCWPTRSRGCAPVAGLPDGYDALLRVAGVRSGARPRPRAAARRGADERADRRSGSPGAGEHVARRSRRAVARPDAHRPRAVSPSTPAPPRRRCSPRCDDVPPDTSWLHDWLDADRRAERAIADTARRHRGAVRGADRPRRRRRAPERRHARGRVEHAGPRRRDLRRAPRRRAIRRQPRRQRDRRLRSRRRSASPPCRPTVRPSG